MDLVKKKLFLKVRTGRTSSGKEQGHSLGSVYIIGLDDKCHHQFKGEIIIWRPSIIGKL
jgi:hypothetical protein